MMKDSSEKEQIEYGDFQTPLSLAKRVCEKLVKIGVVPDIIIEPTCGMGAFIEAAAMTFNNLQKIYGIEINQSYLNQLEFRKKTFFQSDKIKLLREDFFTFNFKELLNMEGMYLIIGNFPWVTNSQQSIIGGENLPTKRNFYNRSGFDAMTGKSNFDISEWMLIRSAELLRNRKGYLAMLCKTSVARKFLNYLHSEKIGLQQASIYGIDAKGYFNVSVEACLLFCEFDPQSHNYDYDFFTDIDSLKSQRVGHRNGLIVRDLDTFNRLNKYYGVSKIKWRSGIKHDCSDVMEVIKAGNGYINGLGEFFEIESEYLYPLLKGSDVANKRTSTTNRYTLVTQRMVGESTNEIKNNAPKTWAYLEKHAEILDKRKSRIYKNNPRFSIFGVGKYTFAPFKIAICSLYKKLDFQLIHQIGDKPVVFDDTVYFLSFQTEYEALKIYSILTSTNAQEFYSSLIFWDEKRPIKCSILNCLDFQQFEKILAPRLF